MRVCFILGAGYSQSFGMPSTDDLTDLVLNHLNWADDTNTELTPDLERENKKLLLSVLYENITDKLVNKYPLPTFEDLIEALDLITAYLFGFNHNALLPNHPVDPYHPLLPGFIKNFISNKQIEKIIDVSDPLSKHFKDLFLYLTRELRVLISLFLAYRQELINEKNLPQLISDCCMDNECDVINFVTLNYDTILEQSLQQANFQYSRGFTQDKPVNNILLHGNYSFNDKRIRICKIHGSIDWFSGFGMESSTSGYFPEIFEPSATILNLYYQTKRRPFTFVPTFLMGRDHKIRSYSISEFGDLSNYFRVSVQNADILVLIGFSGKDLNVSRVIENWLMENLTKRNLWIIDPAGEEVKKRLLVWAEKPDVANQVKIVPNMDAANWNDIKSNSV